MTVKTRRSVLASGLALGAAAIFPNVTVLARSDPQGFIEGLGNQALGMIRANRPRQQKQVYFHELLKRDFDIAGISRFVLGRYWRAASEPQRVQFRRLLADYLVLVYSRRFARYRGESLRVTGSHEVPGGVIVASQIIRPGAAKPILVDWRLARRGAFYRIEDVVIDKVSMAITERSRFAGIIERHGGGVPSLIAMLQKELASSG